MYNSSKRTGKLYVVPVIIYIQIWNIPVTSRLFRMPETVQYPVWQIRSWQFLVSTLAGIRFICCRTKTRQPWVSTPMKIFFICCHVLYFLPNTQHGICYFISLHQRFCSFLAVFSRKNSLVNWYIKTYIFFPTIFFMHHLYRLCSSFSYLDIKDYAVLLVHFPGKVS